MQLWYVFQLLLQYQYILYIVCYHHLYSSFSFCCAKFNIVYFFNSK